MECKIVKNPDEADAIFEDVHRKQQTLEDEHTALISLDTKDKVLLVSFSRSGKSRIQINAVESELTNDCLISFGDTGFKERCPNF